MIDKRELRIGNYVFYELTFHVITGIMEHTIMHAWMAGGSGPIGAGYYTTEEELEPIPLDEDWLIRLGFTKKGEDKWQWVSAFCKDTNISIILDNGQFYILFDTLDPMCPREEPVHTVHNLQNIFIDIDNKYLTWEPSSSSS